VDPIVATDWTGLWCWIVVLDCGVGLIVQKKMIFL